MFYPVLPSKVEVSTFSAEGKELRYLSLVSACNSAGKLTDYEICSVTDVLFVEITEGDSLDKTVACKKLLCQGSPRNMHVSTFCIALVSTKYTLLVM